MKTFVQNAFFAQPVDGRLYDAFAHLFHKYLIGKTETGVTLPIPPVFNPLSPSPIRL